MLLSATLPALQQQSTHDQHQPDDRGGHHMFTQHEVDEHQGQKRRQENEVGNARG